MKKTLLALSLAAVAAQASALTAGDIAVIAVNSDGDDNFAWVALTDIAAGTVINFTDSSYQGTAIRSTEHLDAGGPLTWSYGSTLAAGTVITYSGAVTNTWSLGAAGGTGLSLSTSGDQIFAFEGSASSPSFVYGLQFANAAGIVDAPTVSNSTNTTNVPGGLSVAGGTMLNVGNYDDSFYQGVTTGTQAQLLAAIADVNNWYRSDSANEPTQWASSFTVAAVPEPETYGMLLSGLALLAGVARRRNKA